MLPQASLRLNQGFGRLIRSSTDRGVVVLADPRIVSRTYGRALLDALPPARRAIGRWPLLRAKITAFYQSEGMIP
jgi:ATP-dependent DNA helicase DinG